MTTEISGITEVPGGLCAALGFQAAGLHTGIKPGSQKPDLMLLVSDSPAATAAVYTQNKVQGAPITVTKRHLADGVAQAILCNSGNANTCAPGGVDFAEWSCQQVAIACNIAQEDVLVASTGVIGQELPKEPFSTGIPHLAEALSPHGGYDAANAMITTDTCVKECAVSFTLDGKTCHLGGAAKGSGMMNPNMATLLCFVTTDVAIAQPVLQQAVTRAAALTLNQICIDGDTSTNDMLAVMANGLGGNTSISEADADYQVFLAALTQVLTTLSKMLAADGEGATKLLSCAVSGAGNDVVARRIAKSVIASDLFKAAMFGADANWGRVLCAIGYTPGDFSVDDISVTLQSAAGSVVVCQHSTHHPYSEDEAALILAEKEIDILVSMGAGLGQGTAWGCDLSYDYVKINGDYRS